MDLTNLHRQFDSLLNAISEKESEIANLQDVILYLNKEADRVWGLIKQHEPELPKPHRHKNSPYNCYEKPDSVSHDPSTVI